MTLSLRPAAQCRYDAVSLGEVMLRLDPGEGRIRTARQFRAWEGGGEYNVARGLAKCFGLRTAVVTALVDNEVGHLVEELILTGGVDTHFIQWVKGDAMGRDVRNGLNFTERGFGVRGAKGVSDRGNTAVSQMRPDAVDWDDLFGRQGVRWFHTGGIFAGLSDTTADVAIAAAEAARKHGTVVSYDLNYRPSLWSSIGGTERAREVNLRLASLVDVMIGNEEDYTAALGFEVPGGSDDLASLPIDGYTAMLDERGRGPPSTGGRRSNAAYRALGDGERLGRSRVVARRRSRDGDAAGWAGDHGPRWWGRQLRIGPRLRTYGGPRRATSLEYGAAHGALAMTTPGDTSMATLAEVEALVRGGGARVQR